jgi:hypothetical protein
MVAFPMTIQMVKTMRTIQTAATASEKVGCD